MWGRGGRLFEAGHLLTFSAFRMGANSRLGAYSNKYGNQVFFFWQAGVCGWVGILEEFSCLI